MGPFVGGTYTGMLIVEGVLLLLINVNLLLLLVLLLSIEMLMGSLLFEISGLRDAIYSLLAVLLSLTSHAHVHFLSRIRSLLLGNHICNHSGFCEIGCFAT